jgi:hypothetical protein
MYPILWNIIQLETLLLNMNIILSNTMNDKN